MNLKSKLILLCLVLFLFNIVVVSATDTNLTDGDYLNSVDQGDNLVSVNDNLNEVSTNQSDKKGTSVVSEGNNTLMKENITLTPVSSNITFGENLKVLFKDQNGRSYANLPVFVKVDGKNIKSLTDGDGNANFSLNKDGGVVPVELIYLGNSRFNPYSKVVKINIQKLFVSLTPISTTLVGGESLKVQFKDQFNRSYANLPVFVRIDGKNYKAVTDKEGYVSYSINMNSGVVPVELIYLGNGRFNPYSQLVKINVQKYDVSVTPLNTKLVGADNLNVQFKDQFNKSYANLPVFMKVNGKNYKAVTDKDGHATFYINMPSGVFSVELIYLGNSRYNPYSQVFNISLQKYKVILTPVNATIIAGKPLKVLFKDQFGKSYANLPVFVKIAGKNFKAVTDKKGYANINVDANSGKTYSAELVYQGNKQYNPYSKKFSLLIRKPTSITIGNDKLLKGGYLRVYLKSDEFWAVAKQTLTITVGTKKFVETTNSEGLVTIKPNMTKKTYTVDVDYKGTKAVVGSHASKKVEGIYGNPIDPLYEKVPSKNGMPDIDYMMWYYVMGDGDMTYTVKESQYKEVMQRDSYCLYLNNKLTKYTIFKTKSEPLLYHLIHRTKWNVIEREVLKKLVLKNQNGFWPSEVTASLKGKAYTYSEVRDVQNTEYTCGPTSCSMCSQVLKNYVCESYLARLAGTQPEIGTSTSQMVSAMKKYDFKCEYFYKSSYEYALNELKKGGCAVVFHTKNHYVALLDISKDGTEVLVSNSYGSFYNIPTGWLSTSYMKTRYYKNYDDGLIVRLDYSLSQPTKKLVNYYYTNMGSWTRQNTNENIWVDY